MNQLKQLTEFGLYASIAPSSDTYVVRVANDSLAKHSITRGDYVVVRRFALPNIGELAAYRGRDGNVFVAPYDRAPKQETMLGAVTWVLRDMRKDQTTLF